MSKHKLNISDTNLAWLNGGHDGSDSITREDIEAGRRIEERFDALQKKMERQNGGPMFVDFAPEDETELRQIVAYRNYVGLLKSRHMNRLTKKAYRAIDSVDDYFSQIPLHQLEDEDRAAQQESDN